MPEDVAFVPLSPPNAPNISDVPVRTCKIEEILTQSLIDLAQVAPNNEVVRGGIMSLTGVIPPPELKTFEQIKDWIEFSFKKKDGSEIPFNIATGPTVRANGARNYAFDVSVDFSQVTYGRCRYSVSQSGTSTYEIGADEMREMVDEGTSVDSIVRRIVHMIQEDGWDCDPQMESDWESCEYSDYEESDTEDHQIEVETRPLTMHVKDWMLNHCSHEELTRFGLA